VTVIEGSATLAWDVLELMPDAITLASAVRDGTGAIVDMRVAYLNATARTAHPHAAVGALCGELWPDLAANGCLERCHGVLATGIPISGECANGSIGFDYRATRVGIDMLVWIVRDSSERLRANATLTRSNADLAAFAHVLAHDLRLPLTTILGNAELLADGTLPDAERRTFAAISRNAARMGDLISTALAYSRPEAASVPEPIVDPTAVVGDLIDDLWPAIEAADAVVSVAPLLPVRADPVQVGQLIQNLLCGALSAALPDRPLKVSIGAVPAGTGWVEFTVTDTGAPFLPQPRAAAFAQVHRERTPDGRGGTGIGLATCARIVDRHGGRIWVGDPSPATVHFTLPAA
jgi:signal transduction histidine kinase